MSAGPSVLAARSRGWRWLVRDEAIGLALALLVVASRWPFHAQFLFNWDAVNFARAMEHFDVRQHSPHPPGYFYFVSLGRLIRLWGGDANASLVWESTFFSVLAVVALYFLGRALYGRAAGLAAALFLASSVSFWSYGELALSYTALAFFSSLTALLAYRALVEKRDTLLPLTAVYSLAGGFRAELLLFLAPLWLAALARWYPNYTWRCLGMAGAGLGLWLGPTVWLSGGPGEYYAVLSAYAASDVLGRYSVWYNGWAALVANGRDLANYTFYALYGLALALGAGATYWLWTRGMGWGKRELFLVAWVAPMLLFYTFIHIGDPGYVFSFAPALMLLAARFWAVDLFSNHSRRRALVAAGVLVLVAANSAIFLWHPRMLTAPGLRQRDAALGERLRYLKENPAPDSTLLLAFESYRHLTYYLPQYRYAYWVDLFSPQPREEEIPAGVSRVIVVDDTLVPLAQGPAQAISLPGGGRMGQLEVQSARRLRYGPAAIALTD